MRPLKHHRERLPDFLTVFLVHIISIGRLINAPYKIARPQVKLLPQNRRVIDLRGEDVPTPASTIAPVVDGQDESLISEDHPVLPLRRPVGCNRLPPCISRPLDRLDHELVDGLAEITRLKVHRSSHGAHIADANLGQDRKSTRLNSSHVKISYAVFCLK